MMANDCSGHIYVTACPTWEWTCPFVVIPEVSPFCPQLGFFPDPDGWSKDRGCRLVKPVCLFAVYVFVTAFEPIVIVILGYRKKIE